MSGRGRKRPRLVAGKSSGKKEEERQRDMSFNKCKKKARKGCDLLQVAILCVILFSQKIAKSETSELSQYYPIVGETSQEVQLPCLLGRLVNCGEPYLIAWYKSIDNSRTWTRLDREEEQEPSVRFNFNQKKRLKASSNCEHPAMKTRDLTSFDCYKLSLGRLELADEGLYKCEVTFTDMVDPEKCPTKTISQLSVIAQPNGPELLVNGRQLYSSNNNRATFKEGAQIKLECQSSGGKPAPSIKWLNVSLSDNANQRISPEPIRGIRRFGHSTEAGQPLTTSMITLSLTRYDLNSVFACLVLPAPLSHQLVSEQDQLITQAVSYLSNNILLNQESSVKQQPELLLKWIKLDVQVKPSNARLLVRDLLSNSTLKPVDPTEWARPIPESIISSSPFYSLEPNKLYAIQCQVDGARPRAQLAWFNRSAPIDLVPNELPESGLDYELPSASITHQHHQHHRLSSFTRTFTRSDGTFSTISTLLLSSSPWNNLEELFCRISTDAFQFDELVQVAPILSAKLYVNYEPLAWLEIGSDLKVDSDKKGILKIDEGKTLTLHCYVGANPLVYSTIVQIEWLKDGKKLSSSTGKEYQKNKILMQQASSNHRFRIEKANHLHMPQQQSQLLQSQSSSKLICFSTLTIELLAKTDSASYSCQFKLIPAPGNSQPQASSSRQQQQQQHIGRITSGQANYPIQVNVIEGKASAPTLRISSSKGLVIYGLKSAPGTDAVNHNHQSLSVVLEHNSQLSLKCELSNLTPELIAPPRKILWYLNNVQLHSSSSSDTFNLSVDSLLSESSTRALGSITCAHYVPSSQIENNFQANQMRIHQSYNQLELKLRAGPKLLLERRELMPTMRSFSELELSANPASKLSLICLAQCEPICSIDWFLNERPLVVGSASDRWLPLKSESSSTHSNVNQFSRYSNSIVSDYKFLTNLMALDSLTYKQSNESSFTWMRTSSLSSSYTHTGATVAAESIAKLNRDAELLLMGANVFAKLELSYNQIKQLLVHNSQEKEKENNDNQILIKCRLNPNLGRAIDVNDAHFTFGHLLLESGHYFPSIEQLSPTTDGHRGELSAALSDQTLNLTDLSISNGKDVNNLNDDNVDLSASQTSKAQLWTTDFLHKQIILKGRNSSLSSTSTSGNTDEMQISIFLDKPPRRVSISFSNIVSTDQDPNGVTISESQLLELIDPTRAEPVFDCSAPSFPAPQIKWTFTDLNKSEHLLANDGQNSRKLSLRQFIELRQRHLNLDLMSVYGVDLVSGIVGNYTCTATNIHGSRSATMPLQIQGRPLCKLTLGSEYLNLEHELMVNLRCSIYSSPALLETIWFRNGQQLFVNKSFHPVLDTLMIRAGGMNSQQEQLVTVTELPIQVLNKQQDFMLMDLMAQMANFKCIARNPLGYSEACELSQPDKLTLMNAFRPNGSLLATKSPAQSMISFPVESTKQIGSINLLTLSNTSLESSSHKPAVATLIQNIFERVDWVLVVGCLLAATWLLFLLGSSIVRRRLGAFRKATQSSSSKNNTSWRFSTATRTDLHHHHLARENHSLSGTGLPFQSKICANYYGGSNGDSDHDMIQSCSQSSHYEDYTAGQNQQLQLQQRLLNQPTSSNPIYFNGHPPSHPSPSPPPPPLPIPLPSVLTSSTTLNRRNFKTPPISTSSSTKYSGDSSIYSNRRLIRLNEHGGAGAGVTSNTRELLLGNNHSSQQQQQQKNNNSNKLAATMRESLSSTNNKRYSTGLMTLTPNVPLITGINTTRPSNLDQQIVRQQQQLYRSTSSQQSRDKQTFSPQPRKEHIYDDVIYNQMIL